MHIVRALFSGIVLVGLGSCGLAVLPGCGDDSPPSGGTVKVDPAESKERERKIEDMYKAKPAKGPGGQTSPADAKKK